MQRLDVPAHPWASRHPSPSALMSTLGPAVKRLPLMIFAAEASFMVKASACQVDRAKHALLGSPGIAACRQSIRSAAPCSTVWSHARRRRCRAHCAFATGCWNLATTLATQSRVAAQVTNRHWLCAIRANNIVPTHHWGMLRCGERMSGARSIERVPSICEDLPTKRTTRGHGWCCFGRPRTMN